MKYFLHASLIAAATLWMGASSAMSEPAPQQPDVNPNHYLIKDAPLPTDFVLGKKEAPVVIVEYASLSCPHCAHFSNNVLPEIEKKYIETGKVRYVLRQFPLNEPALKGAMLLNCVSKKGGADKYYTFARVLFDAQSKWAFDGNWQDGLATIANVGGVGKEAFQSCISDTALETKLLKDKKLVSDELKIPHTPFFFIDGQAYKGKPEIEAVSAFIDTRLAAKK